MVLVRAECSRVRLAWTIAMREGYRGAWRIALRKTT